jgi:hypothetical protein
MDTREYRGEMAKLIEDYIPADKSGWTTSVQAAKLVQNLLETDPELLQGWLRLSAPTLMRMVMDEIVRSRRRTSSGTRGAQFGRQLAFYQQHACEGHVRKVASEMTAADHRFVSGRYLRLASTHGMLGAFHKAVAERIEAAKAATTADVYDQETYQAQLESIVRGPSRLVS